MSFIASAYNGEPLTAALVTRRAEGNTVGSPSIADCRMRMAD
jgi:hypothetical protein